MTSVGNSHKNGPIAHWQDSNVLFQIIMVSTNLPIIEVHWLEHTNTLFGTSDSSLKTRGPPTALETRIAWKSSSKNSSGRKYPSLIKSEANEGILPKYSRKITYRLRVRHVVDI